MKKQGVDYVLPVFKQRLTLLRNLLKSMSHLEFGLFLLNFRRLP